MANYMQEKGGLGLLHRASDDVKGLALRWREGWTKQGKIAISVGSINRMVELNRIEAILDIFEAKDLILCVDLAHGHSQNMTSTLEYIRKKFDGTIIAGNVCTSAGCVDLHNAGADIIKVGVGPGGNCTTRENTGCGRPQLSAVMDCAATKIPIIADGGIKNGGHVAKYLAAGAKAVMIGGLLGGTDCTPLWKRKGLRMEVRGMASIQAKKASGVASKYEEGVSAYVESEKEGSTEEVIEGLLDGLVSAMSYSGSATLEEFERKAKFIKVSASTLNENRAHVND